MRRESRLSLNRAAKLEGIKAETVRKYSFSDLKKLKGKFHAKKSDRHSVTLYLPDASGNIVSRETHSSKERSKASKYLRAFGRYVRGDRDALLEWEGKTIGGADLLTDARTIRTIEPALSDFSLYRSFNGGGA